MSTDSNKARGSFPDQVASFDHKTDVTANDEDQFSSTAVIPADIDPDVSADARVQVGSFLRDRFLLRERISDGGMGVVYKAIDRHLAEPGSHEPGSQEHWVAVKILPPQLAKNKKALRALQQEAAKGRCLVHPNIVRFIDLDRDDDLYFLIMEWLEGRTLADILDSKDASMINVETALRIAGNIGDALAYAHSRGIVHADIKPGNIIIMPNGDAKLFDFGIARIRQQYSDPKSDPDTLTPAYSSMQVLTGEEPVAADDVFSLSCLLYRLIAGYRVFGPRNAAEASQEGMMPQRLKELNDDQWRALKKGLSYSRVMRFSSVREFLDAFNKVQDVPFRLDEPDRIATPEKQSGGGKSFVAVLVIAGLVGVAEYQFGFLDPLIRDFTISQSRTPGIVENNKPAIQTAAAVASEPEPSPLIVKEEPSAAAEEKPETKAIAEPVAAETEILGPDPMLVDFSKLPPATTVIPFSPRGASKPVSVVIREDGAKLIIDFVRDSGLSKPMTLRLEEVGFSGNRSPWATGQYTLSNSGVIHFPAGQPRGRIILTMASDPLREADQVSTLRLREAEFADSEMAVINVTLEDDDQRVFESRLPANTIAFAAGQVSIRETDPAVLIDLVRFNPDDSQIAVTVSMSDITATEGEDYFAPGGHTIRFGPGQRSARLLVPLVQDTEVEGDEAFVIKLVGVQETTALDVYRRIVVMIRDDESQIP